MTRTRLILAAFIAIAALAAAATWHQNRADAQATLLWLDPPLWARPPAEGDTVLLRLPGGITITKELISSVEAIVRNELHRLHTTAMDVEIHQRQQELILQRQQFILDKLYNDGNGLFQPEEVPGGFSPSSPVLTP